MEDGKSGIQGTAYTVIQRMADGEMSTDVLDLTQAEFESLVQKHSGGFHNGQKYVPFTQEEAEKRVEVGEVLVGKGSVRTEGFDKSVVFLMSLMEQLWQVSQQHKSFRMELFYNAETLKTNYCFYKQTAFCKKAVCHEKIEEMEIEEFNRLLLEYSKSPPRSKL